MNTQILFRTGLAVTLALGILASAVPSSFAAAGGRGGGGSNGGGGGSSGAGGGGRGGSPDPTQALVIPGAGDCRTNARCQRRPVQIVTNRELQHCDRYEWQTVVMPDGVIGEDRSRPMRKVCLVLPSDD